MKIRNAGVSFWDDNKRSGKLTFKVKMAGLSWYYRSADPPINPTMQSAAGLFWFLTSSCFRLIGVGLTATNCLTVTNRRNVF